MNNVQKYTRTQIWWNTFKTQFYFRYKGTTRVVFQVTFRFPCQYGNAQFTTNSLQKWPLRICILTAGKHIKIMRIKPIKWKYLPHYWSYKGFKCTVVNQALPSFHEGTLEITFTSLKDYAYLILMRRTIHKS